MLKASELFVRCLETEQIECVFGAPGEENADFFFSLDESQRTRFILTRHEQAATFTADVYGRLTGNPAVACGTFGPGATNLVTGAANPPWTDCRGSCLLKDSIVWLPHRDDA